ncbi:MAG: ATP-dependent 6-phosphofructokinase [Candidatus Bathyarchaeia archaeon]
MKIGIVTSGGDAPGMNAAIRALVRYAFYRNSITTGVERGYSGLIYNLMVPLEPRSVGNILHQGGTILRSSRCPEIRSSEGLSKAAETLKSNNIDGLVVIGGDGSFRGAVEISRVSGIPCIGIPATIDNDVFGTEETIGFDTAVNTAVEAIDRIRDTALSHERVFFVEVMGRNRGFLALHIGICTGAGVILVPEVHVEVFEICRKLRSFEERGKRTTIIVAAEGIGNTAEIAASCEKNTGLEVRYSKLGYIQRGGSPTARSRLLADLFAREAIELLITGGCNMMVGLREGRVISTSLSEAISQEKPLDMKLYRLAEELAI